MLGALTTPTSSLNFGSFTLLAKLARGDIGDLFLARSQGAGGFEKLVIIKRIHPEFMQDSEISSIFHSEAQTAARIEHPNVRIVYEIGSNGEHHYIALEYLEGVPLVELLLSRKRERRLADPRLISSLISQACQGLHAAHKIKHRGQPLVHGDINPRSIFVTESGTTKLLDFDIVEMRGSLAKSHGFVRRTIAYMSPEEVRSNVCDQRSDIFSLGVVAWEAITGRRLFKQENRDQTLTAIDRGQIPNAKDLQSGISDALNATIMRSLSRDPSLRFQTAQEFGSALDRAMLDEGPPLTPVAMSTLVERTFATSLEQQRAFVRSARQDQDGAVDSQPHGSFTDFEKPTVVATRPADPDDWNSDEPATTVGGQELLEAIEAMADSGDSRRISGAQAPPPLGHADPFQEIAQNADFSIDGEPPIWQDTRNLVLSEVEAETISASDDEEKTGAVVLPNLQNLGIENYTNSETAQTDRHGTFSGVTQDTTFPGGHNSTTPGSDPATTHDLDLITTPGEDLNTETGERIVGDAEPTKRHKVGPTPALEGPLVASPEPKVPATPLRSTAMTAAIYDRRLSTISSRPRGAQLSSLPTTEDSSVGAKAPPAKRPKLRYAIAVVGAAALVFAALLLLSSDDKSKVANDTEATTGPGKGSGVVSSKSATTSGAGAAAGILAAAGGTRDAAEKPLVIPDPEGDTEAGADPEADTPVKDVTTSEPVVSTETVVTAKAKTTPAKTPTNVAKKKPVPKKTLSKTNPKTKTTISKTSKPASANPGYLTVAANPYATVFIDGKKRGITPIVKLKLPPGIHRLQLVSSAGGKSKNIKIRITSGDVVRQNVTF